MELATRGLGKRYRGGQWGLRNFSLALGPGVLGLLGPNGAGKSTLLRMLATVTRPSEGSISWNGTDVATAPEGLRRDLGYLPQDFGVYPHLTAVEFLDYLAAVKGLDRATAKRRIEELLVLTNLSDERHRPLGGFSGGMRQRVGIAQALLADPRLLIVDEPTTGLDPEERVRFRELLTELSGERIVVLSTHIVSDVEAVAGRLAVVDRGALVTAGAPEALLAEVAGRVWICRVPSGELDALKRRGIVSATTRRSDGVEARVVAATAPAADARAVDPNLEDAYLAAIARHRGETA
jgi:ABC-type multidrug transport system ATPase subunit